MSRFRRLILVLAAATGFVDLANAEESKQAQIRPGDTLCITLTNVYPEHSIDGAFLVQSDGLVKLGAPYPHVRVAGMTLQQATTAITNTLGKDLVNPEVVCLDFCKSTPSPCQKAGARRAKEAAGAKNAHDGATPIDTTKAAIQRAEAQTRDADVLAYYVKGAIRVQRPKRKGSFLTEADFLKYLSDRNCGKKLLVVTLSKGHEFIDPKQTLDGFFGDCKKSGFERIIIHTETGTYRSPIIRE